MLCGILFLVLFIWFEKVIYQKVGKYYALAMMFSLFCISYHTLWLSVALVPTIVIMILSSIFVIKRHEKIKDYNVFFFIIGSITCFFGWMNFQFITLTMPLMFYYLVKKDNAYTFKEFLGICIAWGMGFGITWISKWVITDVLYNTGAIKDALNQIFYRAGTDIYQKQEVSALSSILINFLHILIQLMIQGMILVMDFCIKNRKINKDLNKKEILIYIMVMLIPFVACAVFKNHSFLHARSFVYRNFIIMLFNIFIIYHKAFLENKKELKTS